MGIKEDINDTKKELDSIKQEQKNRNSLAWDICKMLKQDNKRLFIANIIEGIALIIALIIIVLR